MKNVFALLLTFIGFASHAQLVVRVTTLPASTPPNSNVHVAGNFNNWNPGDPNYQLNQNTDGTKTISLYPPVGKVEYKFTRGDWQSAEGNTNGDYLPNRSYQYDGRPSTVNVAILSWEDLDGKNTSNSTATKNVHILHTNFDMPQLDRGRRIWIYLPPDYDQTQKKYPVIYMHDGQNLFDNSLAFAGEWQVDETMNKLFDQGDHGAIIVGIENGGWRRLDEYSPWYNEQLEAGGEGKEYIEFIVRTLKPYVDATYRTLPGREYTGMIGSSMGGLISHYATMEYQDVFGKVGVFSPSFWFTNDSYSHTLGKGKRADVKYYMLAGQKEGAEMVDGVNKMMTTMKQAGFTQNEVAKKIDPNGMHTESFWAGEFGAAYQWLFSGLDFSTSQNEVVAAPSAIILKPNPAYSQLWIENFKSVEGAVIYFTSIDGKQVRKYSLNGNGPVDINSLSEGTHMVNIMIQNRVIHSEKIIVLRG